MVRYFRERRNIDPLYIRAMIAVPAVNDTAAIAVQMAGVHLYTISHWGDVAYESQQSSMHPAHLITTAVTQLLVQAFLIQRVYKLTRSWIPLPFLFLSSLAGGAGAIGTAVTIVMRSANSQRHGGTIPITTWLVASAVTDVGIALLLFVFLFRARRQVLRFEANTIAAPLKKLMVTTVESGSISTAIAIVV